MEHLPEAIEGARQDVAPCVNRMPLRFPRKMVMRAGAANRMKLPERMMKASVAAATSQLFEASAGNTGASWS